MNRNDLDIIKKAGLILIRDRTPGDPNSASVVSVGYGLAALAIGLERKWVTYEQAYGGLLPIG